MPDLDPYDQLSEEDYSAPKDFSAGNGNYTNNYLQNRERNPGQQHENQMVSSEALAKRENTTTTPESEPKPASSKNGFYSHSSGSQFSRGPLSGKGGKLSAQVKKRIAIWVFGLLFGGGGSVLLLLSGPKILSQKILDVINKRFMAPTQKVVSTKTKTLWKCKLSSQCSKKVNDAENKSDDKGEGMGQISDEAKQSIEANGGEVNETKPGVSDGSIKLDSGIEVTSDNIDNLSAKEESDFTSASPATNETYGASAGEPTADMLKETGANKNIPLEDGVGNDEDTGKARTIEQQLEDQANSTKDDPRAPPSDLTSQIAETVHPDETPDFVKGAGNNDKNQSEDTKAGFIEPEGGSEGIEDAKSIRERANSAIDEIPDSLKKAGSAAGNFIGFACGASGINKDILLGIKLAKILSLAKFAYTFITVLNSVQAADGSGQPGHTGPTAEQFSQVMNALTTVLKDKNGKIVTKSGTDSFGYQAIAGYVSPKGGSSFDLLNAENSADAGSPTKFTSSVITNGQAGQSNDWLNALSSSDIPGKSTITAILKGGCPYAMDALNVMQVGGLINDGLSIVKPTGWPGLGLQAVGFLTSLIAGGNQMASDAGAILQSAGACVDAVTNVGVGWGGCVLGVLSAAVVIATPYITDSLITGFKKNFLSDPMPVGSDAMDAIISGAGASMGMNAAGNGVPVVGSGSGPESYIQLNRELTAYNQRADAIKRANASPLDVYNQATFLGSIAGEFFANLYANGNEPLQMVGSLFGMFNSSLANFANGTSLYADAASDAYASSCTDGDIKDAHIAADPFCNPIYGMPEDKEMGVEDTINAISQWKDDKGNSAISEDGNYDKSYGLNKDAKIPDTGGTSIQQFLSECVTRNRPNSGFTPMGSADTVASGSECAFGNDKNFGDNNLQILYNYIQYYLANSNINQGSNLGAQADGSGSASS